MPRRSASSHARSRIGSSPLPGPPGVPDFRALFHAVPGPYLVLDPALTIVAVSDAYLAVTMTRRESIVGRGIFDVFPDNPDDPLASGVGNLRASLDRVVAERVPDTMAIQRYDIRRPDDAGGAFEVRFWSPVNSPVLDDAGSLAYVIHRVEDVTEFVRMREADDEQRRESALLRSRAEEMQAEVLRRAQEVSAANRQLARINAELRRSETFLNSVVENLPDMVFVKDAQELRFVRVNRAGEELLGHPRSALIGRNDHDFFPADQAAAFIARDREALMRNEVVDIPEEPIDTVNRGRRLLHTKKIPILDERGAPAYLLGISADITARKQAEDDLRAARQLAEQANQAKSAFLSRMSHELRTPLNAILGFSQLLDMDDLTDEQRDNVRYISRAGRHLLDLINEVLDISRIESGNLAISLEPVGVRELIEELTALVGPLAAERGIRIDARHASCRRHVRADRQRLKQVLLNLLSNAIKYNREGGRVTLACRVGRSGRMLITVADTGYGISRAARARLFRPFERLGAEHGAIEGTGMGLSLSKGLVEAMGGRIGVSSTPDVGSRFWVELDVTQAPGDDLDPDHAAGSSEGPRGFAGERTVLLIEDNRSNQWLMEQTLGRMPGISLVLAGSGKEGIELARRTRPDLVLLDLHLPDLPGHEVLQRLKTHQATRALPVIIVSADASGSLADRLRSDGAADFLTKPLDIPSFLDTVEHALARTAGGA